MKKKKENQQRNEVIPQCKMNKQSSLNVVYGHKGKFVEENQQRQQNMTREQQNKEEIPLKNK